MAFNPYNERVHITGLKGDPELEWRVQQCAERGYEEIARHHELKVNAFYTKRGLYQAQREYGKVTVVMRQIKGETK